VPRYSPFDKSFEAIEASDLASLRAAAEGWYVEYKREASTADAMAKSVSAFANTHGGWLFYGIVEKSKDEAVAGEFPGIPRVDVDPALQCLRQAMANAVNPSPHYEVRAVWGPEAAIGLEADRAVICVYVPKGANAPYVHKSGRIYRRVGDGSEPKPENDRFVLDQLWRRSDEILNEYKEWVGKDPELSTSESERPYVRLLMVADPWADRGAWLDVNTSEVRELLKAEEASAYATPFDTVYTSSSGFVGRQLRNNDPHKFGLTYTLNRNLSSELIIPLDIYTPNFPSQLFENLGDYEQIGRFISILEENGHNSPRVVDLNFALNIMMAAADLQDKILKRAGWGHGFHCKVVLLNVWRTVAFVDAPYVMRAYEEHGVPMIMNSRVVSGFDHHPGSFRAVSGHSGS
jgi:hypothetical protein